jgi:hypothetical protein
MVKQAHHLHDHKSRPIRFLTCSSFSWCSIQYHHPEYVFLAVLGNKASCQSLFLISERDWWVQGRVLLQS